MIASTPSGIIEEHLEVAQPSQPPNHYNASQTSNFKPRSQLFDHTSLPLIHSCLLVT